MDKLVINYWREGEKKSKLSEKKISIVPESKLSEKKKFNVPELLVGAIVLSIKAIPNGSARVRSVAQDYSPKSLQLHFKRKKKWPP